MTRLTTRELRSRAAGHPPSENKAAYQRWRRARLELIRLGHQLSTHHRWKQPDAVREYNRAYYHERRKWKGTA